MGFLICCVTFIGVLSLCIAGFTDNIKITKVSIKIGFGCIVFIVFCLLVVVGSLAPMPFKPVKEFCVKATGTLFDTEKPEQQVKEKKAEDPEKPKYTVICFKCHKLFDGGLFVKVCHRVALTSNDYVYICDDCWNKER